MNIFILSLDPAECARFHCDQHLNKMILESAQLMSTALSYLLPPDHWNIVRPQLYKPTHPNHPCSLWLRDPLVTRAELSRRWEYLAKLALALDQERSMRFDADEHGSIKIIKHCAAEFHNNITNFSLIGAANPSCFAIAAPAIFKLRHPIDTAAGAMSCYRSYYAFKNRAWISKGRPAMKYTGTTVPSWLT